MKNGCSLLPDKVLIVSFYKGQQQFKLHHIIGENYGTLYAADGNPIFTCVERNFAMICW